MLVIIKYDGRIMKWVNVWKRLPHCVTGGVAQSYSPVRSGRCLKRVAFCLDFQAFINFPSLSSIEKKDLLGYQIKETYLFKTLKYGLTTGDWSFKARRTRVWDKTLRSIQFHQVVTSGEIAFVYMCASAMTWLGWFNRWYIEHLLGGCVVA